MEKEYKIVDSVEALEETIRNVKKAQQEFSHYTQEQVDKIFLAASIAANQARIPLAKMAVEETGMGVVEDKVIKNHYAAEYIYNKYKNEKTCGTLEYDASYGVRKVAEPLGLIAAVIPTTNPTSTAIFKTLISLKTRNGIIISPHPRAKNSTIAAAKIVLEAAVKAGAPEGIIAWIDVPSLELTNTLMQSADTILATGGPGMVKSAYSSGKPALGVGAGNTPAIIDDTADVILAVNSIIHSKTFDNGMICASEQSVIVLDKVYDAARAEFEKRGCYFLNPEETEKVRKTIIINGALNAKIVGQKAHTIAALADVNVPETTKILIGEVESVDLSEEFAHEKLSPVLAMYRASDFDDALAKAGQLINDGGLGHTSSLYVNTITEQEKIEKFYSSMKTCRVLINTPSSQGGIGDLYNFKLNPSLTLGCGSWGGNSVSENVGIKHLLNIKTVAERRENMLWFRAPEKVYIKRGCLPVALEELKNVMDKKKVFIVTDTFLFENGYTKPITDKLDGYIARSRNEVTTFGKFLDPLADKILVLSALVILVEYGKIPSWIPIIVLAREFIVSGYRLVAVEKGGKVIAASIWGKLKTVTQMIAIIFCFLDKFSFGQFIFRVSDEASAVANSASIYMTTGQFVINIISAVMLVISVVATIFSGVDYLKNGKDLLKD